MCYLFYVFLLLYGDNKLSEESRLHAMQRVQHILGEIKVVTTMWRWYHDPPFGNLAFVRIINFYSLGDTQFDAAPNTQQFLSDLYRRIHINEKLQRLVHEKLSFLPIFQDEIARQRFREWGYECMIAFHNQDDTTILTCPQENVYVVAAKTRAPVGVKASKEETKLVRPEENVFAAETRAPGAVETSQEKKEPYWGSWINP